MSWWRPIVPERSDDAIVERVAETVIAGEIKPEQAQMYERALRTEADGRSTVMRDPHIRPKPPRAPRYS